MVEMVDLSREENEVVTRLADLNKSMEGVIQAITPTPETMFRLVQGTPLIMHARLRAAALTFTVSVAAVVTLTISTVTYVFNLSAADTRTVPFPVVIERGTAITLTSSAGVSSGYLTGTTE